MIFRLREITHSALQAGDYIMWLDADDVIDADEHDKLRAFAKELSADGPHVVMMKYCLSFDETGKCTMWNWRERLIKRSANLRWQGAVHECITPKRPDRICGYIDTSHAGNKAEQTGATS